MATFYWLGKTGNGNVNLADNYTLWPPVSGMTGLPPSASTIPKYGDSLNFSKYTFVSSDNTIPNHPVFGPSGELNGLCGPAGATTLQWLSSVAVNPNCPVALGSSASYFKFRATYVNLRTGVSNNEKIEPSYIEFIPGDGATQSDAIISNTDEKEYTYYLKGTAKTLKSNPSSLTNDNKGIFNLEEMEFTESTVNYGSWGIFNDTSTSCVYNIGPNTIAGTRGIRLQGNNTVLNIKKGFSTSEGVIEATSVSLNNSAGPKINFLTETVSGSSGPEGSSRSYITLRTLGFGKEFPQINVDHGVDFPYMELNSGNINFNLQQSSDTSRILKGSFNAKNARLRAPYGSVAFGVTNPIVITNPNSIGSDNVSTYVVPDIAIAGTLEYKIDVISGYTGQAG